MSPEKFHEKYGYYADSEAEILTKDEKIMLGKDLSHEIVNHYYEIENYIYSLRSKTGTKSDCLKFDKYCQEKFLAILKTYKRYQDFFNKGLGSQDKNISDVFEMVKKDLVERAEKKDLKVNVFEDDLIKNPNIKPVISNYKLYTIFYNLFNNAIKYTPNNGQINIKFLCKQLAERSCLHFAVSDNGIGIPEKEIKKVIMGERGSNTTGIKGTGHGLSRIKGILDSAGGEMKIVSSTDANRSGTQIICKIPVENISKSRKK